MNRKTMWTAEIRNRLSEMQRQDSITSADSLKKDLEDKKRRQARLLGAIETAGDISSLTERLRVLEAEIKSIQQDIANHRPLKIEDAISGIREHVSKELFRFKESPVFGATPILFGREKPWRST